MKISLLMLLLNLAINLALIPTFGMLGAAVAASLTQAFTGILFFRAFIKESRVPMLSALLIKREDFALFLKLIKNIRAR